MIDEEHSQPEVVAEYLNEEMVEAYRDASQSLDHVEELRHQVGNLTGYQQGPNDLQVATSQLAPILDEMAEMYAAMTSGDQDVDEVVSDETWDVINLLIEQSRVNP